MLIDISSLKGVPGKEMRGTLEAYLPEIDLSGNKHKFLGPVVIDYLAINKGNHIHLSGEIRTSIELICGRCLKKIDYPVKISFGESFFQESQIGQLNQQEVLDVLDEGYTYSGNELNLDEFVEQNLFLYLPFKMLCEDACKGFCPKCGINLNQENCNCVINEADPRFAILEKLLMPANSPKEVEK